MFMFMILMRWVSLPLVRLMSKVFVSCSQKMKSKLLQDLWMDLLELIRIRKLDYNSFLYGKSSMPTKDLSLAFMLIKFILLQLELMVNLDYGEEIIVNLNKYFIILQSLSYYILFHYIFYYNLII